MKVPILCKDCGELVSYIEVSDDLWKPEDLKDDTLGIASFRCEKCKHESLIARK